MNLYVWTDDDQILRRRIGTLDTVQVERLCERLDTGQWTFAGLQVLPDGRTIVMVREVMEGLEPAYTTHHFHLEHPDHALMVCGAR